MFEHDFHAAQIDNLFSFRGSQFCFAGFLLRPRCQGFLFSFPWRRAFFTEMKSRQVKHEAEQIAAKAASVTSPKQKVIPRVIEFPAA